MACNATFTIALSNRVEGVKIPGVSKKATCALSCIKTPNTLRRVVCTLGVTIDTFAPITVFISVDLPALGNPISATYPKCVGVDINFLYCF